MIHPCCAREGYRFTTFPGEPAILVPVIKWHLESLTPDIPNQADTIEAFRGAFQRWADVMGPIQFESTSEESEANIVCHFRFDGDPDLPEPFGPPGVLAYAFAPVNNKSEIYFDESEPWALMHSASGFNLQKVAVHEIGHSLGLGHTTTSPGDIMEAIYTPDDNINLTQDTLNGIELLYGDLMDDLGRVPPVDPPEDPEVPEEEEERNILVIVAVVLIIALLAGIFT